MPRYMAFPVASYDTVKPLKIASEWEAVKGLFTRRLRRPESAATLVPQPFLAASRVAESQRADRRFDRRPIPRLGL